MTPGGTLAEYLAGVYLRLGLEVTFKGHCFRDKDYPDCNGKITLAAMGGGGIELKVGDSWYLELVVGAYTKIGGEASLYGAPGGVAFEGKIVWDGIKIQASVTTLGGLFKGTKEWSPVEARDLYRWPEEGTDVIIVPFK